MARYQGVLTTGQVARICQVAPRTVSKWFDSGHLKGYRVPGSKDRRIPVQGLIQFMRSHGMPMEGLETGATRILIIDPERRLSPSLIAALQNQNFYEVQAVESAFAAGVAAAKFEPHVIIVNPSTPELRLADLGAVRQVGGRPREVKLVAIASDDRSVDELRRQGYDSCLVRPFNIDRLLEIVDSVLMADTL